MTGKSDEPIRTIGEVAESLDLPQHVLRFWETRFKEIDPIKRAGGRRFYRARDVELVAAIRCLLYREGYTIKGVQRILKEKGVGAVLEETRQRAAGQSAPPAPAVAPPRQDELPFAPQERAPAVAPEPSDPEPPPTPEIVAVPAVIAPSLAAAPAPGETTRRLRHALMEIEECKRLLTLTKR